MADGKDDLEVSQQSLQRYEEENTNAIAVSSLNDIKRLSTIFIGSGMFKAERGLSQQQQLYQAGVKIIAGVEFGIQPFAAMRGINIIKGNAEMSANLMAAKVKKHPKYDYRVKKWDAEGCVITFYELPYPGAPRKEWDELGESSFTVDDAKTAGLTGNDTWRKFPRNMCFARALSNGVRVYTPDVFYGAPVYVEGEISGEFETKNQETTEQPATALETAVQPAEAAEPQEAEVVEDPEPEQQEEPPEDITVARVTARLHALNLKDTATIRKVIHQQTGKPFIKNCTEQDLVRLDNFLDELETGEETLPEDWYAPKEDVS